MNLGLEELAMSAESNVIGVGCIEGGNENIKSLTDIEGSAAFGNQLIKRKGKDPNFSGSIDLRPCNDLMKDQSIQGFTYPQPVRHAGF